MSGPSSSPDHTSDALQEIHPVIAIDQSVATTTHVVATGVVGTGLNSGSHGSAPIHEDLKYIYASNANVCNFVSVKLSSEGNYHLWKEQMLCLLKSHNMAGLVDKTCARPRASSEELKIQYDSLLKGWIFGSVSENVLAVVVYLPSAKDVWDKLISLYVATATESLDQQEAVTPESQTTVNRPIPRDIEANYRNRWQSEAERERLKKIRVEKLLSATLKGDWFDAEFILRRKNRYLLTEVISNDGSTTLHIAVGIGHKEFVKKLIYYLEVDDVLAKRSSDGSTALHIAAIVGNRYAAQLLVEKNKKLLETLDHDSKGPLQKAYENMHLDTIGYLFEVSDDGGKTKSVNSNVEIGLDLLVNAISAKKYVLASKLIEKFPELVVKTDGVLMTLAKTFPSGLHYVQTLIYPSFNSPFKGIWSTAVKAFEDLEISLCQTHPCFVPLIIPFLVIKLIYHLISMVLYIFPILYIFLWKAASMIVPSIKHIETKKGEWEAAEKVLRLVCDEIDKLKLPGRNHPFYAAPIFEAARQNAYKVVDEILYRSPEAIQFKDKSGYDIIQLAVLHRSHKIYNLVFDIGERKNIYRTNVDSSENNILHLAGKLAPLPELSRITGAALQLQRELQWHEEVKKLVFPTYITKENIFKETPNMVFTREHTNLLKEGERWIKTTAESSSITAALITTIVFAAAITVPGGTNQETGTPLFKKDAAFTIFAISDAISLFASSTALLVFLSILTARFAEKDFLVCLPKRLLIGICALLISTIAMMVAFSATLFLVFCDRKPWMLGPICGSAFIPIYSFVRLQFPLIVDLFRSTYIPIFVKQRKSASRRFNPDTLFFGKKN